MKLFFRDLGGSGKPLVIMHGLFGSSKNWISNGKTLSTIRKVYALDLRNHGDSPHSDSHTLDDLVEDLNEFIISLPEKPDIMGHSMGGMVASMFALKYSEKIEQLIVLDIAPRTYPIRFGLEFDALQIDVSLFNSRDEIDKKMAGIIPDPFIRQFLQMNLEKIETGYRWKLNVKALKEGRTALTFKSESLLPFKGRSLFLLGGKSEYIVPGDIEVIQKLFPNSKIYTIPEAGHYLHYLNADEFLKQTILFLSET